ncbi:ADP-ribose pyrophosphatase [Sinomonas cellulolyticus]|jgi:8-oxo-dGTP pyrophosphatase MutT (NUDIX family)|uniref:NUDIX hydrolase n=1 Tax=Sinomonas cellulolyticus TaxID=2801916 RepID=A0ABS1K5U0_9MICC|nr:MULTISPECIES: NUDIX hydrolase [Sinomonas]MBL0706843.1 NUDIX hydrolase [Sinomonas cellulolyticus]GHG52723.1 ADP-ribose pyrophosphatase [Sinomonas sp. KCTC 49339]
MELSDVSREYFRTLPRRRVAAGLVIRNGDGCVLAVKPNYKEGWLLPGGTVDPGEAPRKAARREGREELGLDIEPGALLLIAHSAFPDPVGDGLSFLYDGGSLPEGASITLQEEELTEWRFVAPEQFEEHFGDHGALHIQAALTGLEEKRTLELEDGVEVL